MTSEPTSVSVGIQEEAEGRVARRRVSEMTPADQMWALCFSFSICKVGRIIAFPYVLKTYNANVHTVPLAECSEYSVSGPLSFSAARMWPLSGVWLSLPGRMCASSELVFFCLV